MLASLAKSQSLVLYSTLKGAHLSAVNVISY